MKSTGCYTAMENRQGIPYHLSDYVLGKYFHDTGIRQGWLPEDGRPAALAVSGGGDSVALLWMFKKFYGGDITAIHINHGIRGSESNDDERFTAMFAKSLGVNFLAVRVNVPSEKMKGESLETSARRIRLHSLATSAKDSGITSILLGHNRDDLAETVLFNILRGTGIRGAVGITESTHAEGVTFFRPLLGLRRGTLRDILRVRGYSWREDSTNNDDTYTRNYIRLKLLPIIETSINTSAAEHLAQFGEDMRKVRDNEDERSREILTSCLVDSHTLDRKKLRKFSHDDIAIVIRDLGRRLGLKTLSRRRCSELAGLIAKGDNFIFQWSGNFTVSGRNGRIYFEEGKSV